MLIIHKEAKNSSSCTAAKAVECLALRTNDKRRSPFLMKRAKRFEARSGTFEWEVRSDHLDDVIRRRDLFEVL